MRDALPRATVITPNLPEAAALTTSLEGKPDSADIDTIKVMTLAAYTALAVKDPRTQYLIQG